MLKLPVWAYNKPPFLKLIKSLYVSLQCQLSLHVSANQRSTKHYQRRWYDMRSEDCNFHRNQTFGIRIDHLFVYFWTSKFVPFHLTARLNKSLSISTWMQWDGISVQWSTPKPFTAIESLVLHVSIEARLAQVSWIGIMVFWNRKEGLWLYHIFKLSYTMFDTKMFLPSFDIDYIGWKHQA